MTDFTPKSGGGGNTRMVIYGANFGTDPSIISVKIGGQSSKAQAKYEYEPQLVVSTLCGYLDEYGKKLFKIY